VDKLGYRPALDGVRGAAIALVVLHHAGLAPAGTVGVDVFFVLSGFLITTLLLEEHAATAGIRLTWFYVRRARRLFPALGALLLAATALYAAAGLLTGAAASSLAACAFYVANVVLAVQHHLPWPVLPVWSLATEEQFYLLWPPLLALALSRRALAWVTPALVIALIAVSAWRLHLVSGDASAIRLEYAPDTRGPDALLLGCLLALARARGVRICRPLAGVAGLAGIVAFALIGPNGTAATYVAQPAVVVAAAAVVGAATDGGAAARLLSTRPLVFLGVISYSVYLWHYLALRFVAAGGGPIALQLTAAVLLGYASYRWIERPFRRRRRQAKPAVAPA
jgi:peptidoglycan/LPS O-acetylase OafA/YrhL